MRVQGDPLFCNGEQDRIFLPTVEATELEALVVRNMGEVGDLEDCGGYFECVSSQDIRRKVC